MFLKNLQMNRNTLITSLLLLSQTAMITNSYSLDLKVDLPPDAGKEPVLYYNPIVNQQADTKSNNATTDVNRQKKLIHKKINLQNKRFITLLKIKVISLKQGRCVTSLLLKSRK